MNRGRLHADCLVSGSQYHNPLDIAAKAATSGLTIVSVDCVSRKNYGSLRYFFLKYQKQGWFHERWKFIERWCIFNDRSNIILRDYNDLLSIPATERLDNGTYYFHQKTEWHKIGRVFYSEDWMSGLSLEKPLNQRMKRMKLMTSLAERLIIQINVVDNKE